MPRNANTLPSVTGNLLVSFASDPPAPPSVLPPRYFSPPTCYLSPSCALFAEITSKIAQSCNFDTHPNQQRAAFNRSTMEQASSSTASAHARQKRVLPSRARRGGPGVGSCDVDIMILETYKRKSALHVYFHDATFLIQFPSGNRTIGSKRYSLPAYY